MNDTANPDEVSVEGVLDDATTLAWRRTLTAADILDALRRRHTGAHEATYKWAFFEEVRCATGWTGIRDGEQRIDAWAMCLWPSQKFVTNAYEVKISRSDYFNEVRKKPDKRLAAMKRANFFWYVTPKGLVSLTEVPEGCGLIEVHPPDPQSQYPVRRDRTYCVELKRAPFHQIEALNMPFIASVLRRAGTADDWHRKWKLATNEVGRLKRENEALRRRLEGT